jgi:hypothetical protein
MRSSKLAGMAISVALLACAGYSVYAVSEPHELHSAFSELVLSSAIAVVIFLAGGVLLASLRLKLISADLGYSLTFRDAVVALSAGQLAGSVFFQLAGQLIGRGMVLSRRGIPASAGLVISGYERFVALGVSLMLAAGGAIYLFGELSFDLQAGGQSLVRLALGLTFAIGAGAMIAWGRKITAFLRSLTPAMMLRLLRSLAISTAIQITTLAAYVILERQLAPHIGFASLIAASCIVMFAASLPISMGGWGLRELSAVVALQLIGLSSASALVIALMIGLSSLAVLAVTALAFMIGDVRPAAPVMQAPSKAPDYAAALDWLLPLAAVTAVFFQIHVPTTAGKLNVNLADPVALVAAALFVLRCVITRSLPQWRVADMNGFALAGCAVIFLSALHGWITLGWNDWGLINKAIGFLMLIAYAVTGALIVARAGTRGWSMLLLTFAVVAASLVLLDVGMTVLIRSGWTALLHLVDHQISGFSQNPNAFAFALLLGSAGLLTLRLPLRTHSMLFAVLFVGVWFSGSRSGLITMLILIGTGLLMRMNVRPLLAGCGLGALSLIAIAQLPYYARLLLAFIDRSFADESMSGLLESMSSVLVVMARSTDGSTMEHLVTVQQGFAMFLANPIFGAGLGAYIGEQIRSTGTPLIIHSTPVWLLAETGLVGFGVFLAAAWRIASTEWRRRTARPARFVILILGVLALMSAMHELLYQRAFWLLLGATLALAAKPALAGRRGAGKASNRRLDSVV